MCSLVMRLWTRPVKKLGGDLMSTEGTVVAVVLVLDGGRKGSPFSVKRSFSLVM
jgi:hypothetical protein